MNTNFLRELRENRPLAQALLIGLLLFVFLWVVISLIFRFGPEQVIGPFTTVTGTIAATSGTPGSAISALVTHTGIVTPIVHSTFTPRTPVPPTATKTGLSRSTFTPLPTNTPGPTQTRLARPTSTRVVPTNTSAPPPTPLPPTPIITIPTVIIPIPTISIPLPTIDLPLP